MRIVDYRAVGIDREDMEANDFVARGPAARQRAIERARMFALECGGALVERRVWEGPDEMSAQVVERGTVFAINADDLLSEDEH